MSRSWLPGVTVILIGVIYLLNRTAGSAYGSRVWALFIALGAVWFFERAWARSRAGIPLARSAWLVSSGLTVLAVSGIMFLGVSFGRAWPIFIVIAGIASLLRTRN